MLYQKIISWVVQIGYGQAILVGSCLGIGFLVPNLWWLALPAIVFMIHAAHQPVSIRKLIVSYMLIWGIKSLMSIAWFWTAYPIDWVAGLSSGVQVVLIASYWLTSGLWLSSGGLLLALFVRGFFRIPMLSQNVVIACLPLFWVISEIFAALIFSVFTAGPGSVIQSYFSFGMIGYLFGTTSLGVSLAGLAGVYGLSILTVSLGVLLFFLYKKLSFGTYALLSVGIIICSFISLPTSSPSDREVTVVTIDTMFDPGLLSTDEGYQTKIDVLFAAVEQALELEPDFILLPEDSRYLQANFDDRSPVQAMTYWRFLNGGTKSVLIDSGRFTTESGATVLRASVFDGRGGSLWQFDKQYLVPQGEYVPVAYGAVLRLLGYGAMIDRVAEDSAYVPGPLYQNNQLPDYLPGVLFCFESVDPRGVLKLSNKRDIPFIAHPISHGWFHMPVQLWQQLDVMLRVQARAAGIPIVSAGNMATGKLYTSDGQIESGSIVESGEYYTLRQFTF